MVHAYRALTTGGVDEIKHYGKRIPKEDIAAEEYNCNIRRYVDNAPPPESHDVRAHLQGGVPTSEVDALQRYWDTYKKLRARCFQKRSDAKTYVDFSAAVTDRRALAEVVNTDPSVAAAHAHFTELLETWWTPATIPWAVT